MTNFSERLELILKIRKLKAYELSLKTKLSQPLISQYLSGKFEPKNDKAYIIAEALDVDISWLMGFSDELKPFEKEKKELKVSEEKSDYHIQNLVKLPIYKNISCGTGTFVDDEIVDYYHIPTKMIKPKKDYFCQYAVGDSMKQANINDGDLLVFEKTNVIEDNQIGCFCIGDEYAICKKFRKSKDGCILVSANENYLPIFIDENHCFKVLGKLAFILSVVNQ